jgi:glycosyltransferase involved in cell wall biosynthesis
MESIRILSVCSRLKPGGPTNQLMELVSKLDPDRYRVRILTLGADPAPGPRERLAMMGVPVDSLHYGRIDFLIGPTQRFRRVVSEWRPHVIHSQGVRSDVLSARLGADVPRISTLRNYPHLDYPFTYGNLMGRGLCALHVAALRRIDSPVACSQSVAAVMNRRFGLRMTVVRNGVDTARFRPVGEVERRRLRVQLGLPPHGTLFLSVGHLSARKDPITVFQSMSALAGSAPVAIVVLGDGPLQRECARLADLNQAIIMRGRVSDPIAYYQAADAFVSMSHAEGFPNTVLEALSSGLPLILSDIPPHREIVQLDPRIGQLVSARDAHALACAIRREAAAQDRHERRAFSRQAAVQHLSSKAMAQRYADIYRRLAEKEITNGRL